MLDAARITELANPDPDSSHAQDDAPCGRHWAVVYTHPSAERWAESNLIRRGYDTFLPLVTVTRRDRVLHTLARRVQVPAFPRYVLVALDTHWTPVRYCPGVHSLLMNDGKPGRVDAAAVDALRAAQALAATTTTQDAAQWAPGAPCVLGNGSLRGHHAVVLRVARETAHLSVMLFGALRQVQAPVAWLVARD
jgi:transcription antitermination factor NusG